MVNTSKKKDAGLQTYSRRQALNGLAFAGLSGISFFTQPKRLSADPLPKSPTSTALNSHQWRPKIHFTAQKGFMNDPCGLIFDGNLYHLYYQLNPQSTQAGNPNWGHATSEDLYHWKDGPIAIEADQNGMAFSGSAILDPDNRSGLFQNNQQHPNLIAFYTKAAPNGQSQWIATSTDGGLHYKDYEKNPILNIGNNSFRDPKVLWHEASQKWVMVVALADQNKISFYGSKNLTSWDHLSDFGPTGLLGIEWECPNLTELKVEDRTQPNGQPETRWVFFISVNPGSPLGGSSTQYFIGNFDGKHFILEDTSIRFVDFAKDNYALQVFNNFPNGEQAYIGWIGNWQYCEELPSHNWSGAMSLPRKIALRHRADQRLTLSQTPINIDRLRAQQRDLLLPGKTENTVGKLSPHENFTAKLPENTAIELLMDVAVEDRGSSEPDGNFGRARHVLIDFSNDQGEKLRLGFDALSCQFWVDRGELRGFQNPFFTNNFSVALSKCIPKVSLHLILDGTTLEIYLNNGEDTATLLIYPDCPLTKFSVSATNAPLNFSNFAIYYLKQTIERFELS
ncbi:glycoside hydrolase family 32 protein [Acetobacteraceae bacterium]|nr:glycoside hydrolase family 32 protein [Acetobacteraceae bacterium]